MYNCLDYYNFNIYADLRRRKVGIYIYNLEFFTQNSTTLSFDFFEFAKKLEYIIYSV